MTSLVAGFVSNRDSQIENNNLLNMEKPPSSIVHKPFHINLKPADESVHTPEPNG